MAIMIPVMTQAQTIHQISGSVMNAANEPLAGNVLALSVSDSSVIKGASYMAEPFGLTGLNETALLLKFTGLQFADTIIQLKYAGQSHINLGIIRVEEHPVVLEEVIVVARTPPFRNRPDGTLEVNVAGTMLATNTSVNEILGKTPNVIVDDNGISVIGRGEAIIYLNGARITAERLSSISASQIDKIEVITNPSSQYDAEGNAIIHIKTKKNTATNLMGTIRQQVNAAEFSGAAIADTFFDLSYRKGKLSLIGNYNLRLGKDREVLHTIRKRPQVDEYLNSDLVTDWQRTLKNYSTYGFGLQYDRSESDNISLAYSGYLENLGGSQDSKNAILTAKENSLYMTETAVKHKTDNHSITLNYNKTLDTLSSALFAGSQYSWYNSAVDDFIDETSAVNGMDDIRFLNNKIAHWIGVSSTQVDYTKAFSERSKLEAGAKFSYVATNSDTRFFSSTSGQDFSPIEASANDFDYTEQIPAIYLNYSHRLGRNLNMELGARGEWTRYILNTSVGGGQVIKDNYVNLFPNISFNSRVSDKLRLRATYAARIQRPRYQSLNPFAIYQDPFTTIEGNPNLIPAKSHTIEMGATYKQLDLTAGYRYIVDPLDAAALRGDDEKSYVLKAINTDKGHSYYVTFTQSVQRNWWTSTNTVTLDYAKFTDKVFSYEVVRPKPRIYLYTSNTFTIPNLFNMHLLAWYMGAEYSGLTYRQQYASIDLGIEKEFLQKALKVQLVANDILNTYKLAGNYDVGQTNIYYRRDYARNNFGVIVAYNFGKLVKSSYRSRSTGIQENDRAR